jgi:hypothetical protein
VGPKKSLGVFEGRKFSCFAGIVQQVTLKVLNCITNVAITKNRKYIDT